MSRLNSTQRTLAQIQIDEDKQLREYQKLLDQREITEQQYADARVAIEQLAWQKQQKAAEDFGGQIESLYDRTIGKAKSFGDAMKNIWAEVMNYWKRQAFNAFAAILLGLNGPAAVAGAPAGAGAPGGGSTGGILGGLLGGIFGGNAGGGTSGGLGGIFGAGSGVITNFAGTSASPTQTWAYPGLGGPGPFGFPIPGFPGGGGGGGLPNTGPIPGLPGAAGGILGALMKNPSLIPALGLLGGVTLGSHFSNPYARAGAVFGGITAGFAGLGALLGSAGGIGAGAGALGGLSLFFTNPYTIIPAAIIAALFGIFGSSGNGAKKEQASQIADQGFAQLRAIESQYKAFQTDYPTAITNMGTIWSQMVSQWQGIGGSVGANSIQDQSKYYQQILSDMQNIYQSRQARSGYAQTSTAALPTSTIVNPLKGLPVPEFAQGGTIPGAGSAGVLVMAHPGEEVMNRAAVQRIGRDTLQHINRGGEGMLMIDPDSSAAIRAAIKRDPRILEEGMLVTLRGSSLVARLLR